MTDTTAVLPGEPKPQQPKAEPKIETKNKPAAAESKPERFVPASESRFDTSVEFRFPHASYVPEAGTPLEHVLRPEYWANIKKLHAGCRVFVYAEDEAWCAELIVRKVGQGYAKVQVLHKHVLEQPTADPKLLDGYDIQYRGPIVKHRIVRLKDGNVLKQSLDSFEEAQAWLRDYKRMLAN
jgi:hypothetical protein